MKAIEAEPVPAMNNPPRFTVEWHTIERLLARKGLMRTSAGFCGLAVLAGLLAVALPATVSAQDLAITNANVLNPQSQTVTAGTLLIRDGQVVEVGTSVTVPPDVETLDAEGRWIAPGFFDLHTHSFGNFAPSGPGQMLGPPGVANVALYQGVVGFLDLFSMEDFILGVRDAQRAGESGGAAIYAAGSCLTATDGHCSEYGIPTRLVDSPEDAHREIAELAAKRPDVIKLVYDNQVYRGNSMPTVDKATMEAVVQAAHDHDLKVVVHIGTWQDMLDASEAGADAVTHTPGPEPIPSGVAEAMVRNGTLHIPTLGVQSELGRIRDDPSLLDQPLLAEVVPSGVLESYRNADEWPDQMAGFATWTASLRQQNLEAVGTLADAGVLMATGTDGGNPGVFQGYSVHREMELLVEAGLTEWEALAAATGAPAAFLGTDWGVHVGAEATLVILDASPLEAIQNTQRVHAVIQKGVLVDRSALLPN